MWLFFIAYGGPLALLVAAFASFASRTTRPVAARRAAAVGTATALLAAAAAAALLAAEGAMTIALPGGVSAVLSARLDVVSSVMQGLVALVGWVVVRYAVTYLDGEPRESVFIGWLCLTLAAVLVLVTAGNLVPLVAAWIATSLSLHRLLLFYPERPGAQRAARKKFLTARVGDAALIGAAAALWLGFGTADIAGILEQARSDNDGTAVTVAAALLGLAALLKSAQFPLHGWLTEMMETPTPVSALLHAGVVNAGGFLLVRFADVMLTAPGVLIALALLGGFTALFGGAVMLTQSAAKTALAWSTVAQMGFMILECGLGLFALALLHIVAHSLYKAHEFLSAGEAVDRVAALRRPGPIAAPGVPAVLLALLTALVVYGAAGLAFGLPYKPVQVQALGAIMIVGIAYLFAQGFADAAPWALTWRTAAQALAASLGYFSLQAVAFWLTAVTLPPPPPAGPAELTVIALALASFTAVAIAQALLPRWSGHPVALRLRQHLMNGLYVNAVLDRLLGNWRLRRAPGSPAASH